MQSEHECSSSKTEERIKMSESLQEFEDLLATNNLFVDYFNAFLLNPELGGERLRFNFMTGDLELIEPPTPDKEADSSDISSRVKYETNRAMFSSTAESVKRQLETQIKAIIKSTSSLSNVHPTSSSSSATANRPKTAQVHVAAAAATNSRDNNKSASSHHLFEQIKNHSFKDLDLIRIEARLDTASLRDPKAAAEARVHKINTRYSVNALKKPFSLKWLRNRRLNLFLQSEFYNEFKLAMILAQFGLFNKDLNGNSSSAGDFQVKYVKIKLDEEQMETKLNPFNVKTDLEKLKEQKLNDDNDEDESSEDEKESASKDHLSVDDETNSSINQQTRNYLINDYLDVYQSIKRDRFPTSLVINRQERQEPGQDEPVDENRCDQIKTVNDFASVLVKSIIERAVLEVNSNPSKAVDVYDPNYIRNTYLSKGKKLSPLEQNSEANILNDFNANKSTSRLSYYKDFQTDIDLVLTTDTKQGESNGDENDDEKLVIEFEDEPAELSDEKNFHKIDLRKVELENFKQFLKENDALLFYKLWIEIERLKMMFSEKEKHDHIKALKLNYNQPRILDRINASCDHVKMLTKKTITQIEKDYYFWSYDNLTGCLQNRLLHALIFYWWPKYCIRLSSFQEYMRKKYPTLHEQNNLVKELTRQHVGFDAENIEKSLSFKPDKLTSAATKKKDEDKKTGTKDEGNIKGGKLLKRRQNVSDRAEVKEAPSMRNKSAVPVSRRHQYNEIPPGLEGYDLKEEYKTSPPVGWKRPPSQATMLARSLYEKSADKRSDEAKRTKTDRDVYLEAIYREDSTGKIFMKYLMSKNKIFATNRLKCLQELIRYKDLFYVDNFDQEAAKKYANEIYAKYISVSASEPIDCPRADRMKIHLLFSSNGVDKTPRVRRKPTYEDTYDSVEEFLLNSLYGEWKAFMENEEKYFNHNELELLERSINIKSKKIDQLIAQGLIRFVPKPANQSSVGARQPVSDSPQLDTNRSQQEFKSTIDFRAFDMYELVNNSRELEMFKKFLESHGALTDLLCWMDIEAYLRADPNDYKAIEDQARALKRNYLNKKYLFSSQKSPIDAETQNIILEKNGGWRALLEDMPSNLLIILAKKHIENKLKLYWLPLYFNSEFSAKSRYNARTQMMDVIDEVLYLKNRQSPIKDYAIKKRRWLYSSQMIINFTKALKNSFTTKVFSKFLALKCPQNELEFEPNNYLINNLQFLIEVQEYKELCQKRAENDKEIVSKSKHIIDCFIKSRIPPHLRIDIPVEVANQILDQKDFSSPYLFLKAYLIVFNNLMPYWFEFNQMRSVKDLEMFDEFSAFKRRDKSATDKRISSATSQDDYLNLEENASKWRYNHYVKALKTQLVV